MEKVCSGPLDVIGRLDDLVWPKAIRKIVVNGACCFQIAC